MSKKKEFIDKLKGPYKVRQELLEARERILIATLSDIRILMEGSDEYLDVLLIPTCLDLVDGCVKALGNLHGDNA